MDRSLDVLCSLVKRWASVSGVLKPNKCLQSCGNNTSAITIKCHSSEDSPQLVVVELVQPVEVSLLLLRTEEGQLWGERMVGDRGRRRDASAGQKLLGCVLGSAVRGVREVWSK